MYLRIELSSICAFLQVPELCCAKIKLAQRPFRLGSQYQMYIEISGVISEISVLKD
jgi:hypothetical protein